MVHRHTLATMVLAAALSIIGTRPSGASCTCNCYYDVDCGSTENCNWSGCTTTTVNGKTKDGHCKATVNHPIYIVADAQACFSLELLSLEQPIRTWLLANPGAPLPGTRLSPDPVLSLQAEAVPMTSDVHTDLTALASQVEYLVLGAAEPADNLTHYPGDFYPNMMPIGGGGCSSAASVGTMKYVTSDTLSVMTLARQAIEAELSNPNHGLFMCYMDMIPILAPNYHTRARCEYPHPTDHHHEFIYHDGLDCLSSEIYHAFLNTFQVTPFHENGNNGNSGDNDNNGTKGQNDGILRPKKANCQ